MSTKKKLPDGVSSVLQGKPRAKMQKILASRLSVDHSYQREVNAGWARRIARSLDLDALGVIWVSRRTDGSLWVVDGQHRIEALREHGFEDEWTLDCRVHEGLSIEDEARLYRLLNRQKKSTPWDDFKAGLAHHDQRCMDIDAIADSVGLAVSGFAGDGRICCVATLNKIYDRYGGKILHKALEWVTAAWGGTASAVEKDLVNGLAVVAAERDGEIESGWLIKKLSKSPGGPSGLLGRAKALKEVSTSPVARLVAMQVVALYNKGRRSNKIEDLEK